MKNDRLEDLLSVFKGKIVATMRNPITSSTELPYRTFTVSSSRIRKMASQQLNVSTFN